MADSLTGIAARAIILMEMFATFLAHWVYSGSTIFATSLAQWINQVHNIAKFLATFSWQSPLTYLDRVSGLTCRGKNNLLVQHDS